MLNTVEVCEGCCNIKCEKEEQCEWPGWNLSSSLGFLICSLLDVFVRSTGEIFPAGKTNSDMYIHQTKSTKVSSCQS